MNSYQYYPTGAHTAARMWAKFKRPVRHLCDPSAGRGHLIRHAKDGFPGVPDDQIPWLADIEDEEFVAGSYRHNMRAHARLKFNGIREVSVVEIDLQHHASLKELGAQVLGFDFLQVSSLATVSSLIMNPPFAEGCAHVLHAWDCLYDAEMVAIINAATIKNPNTRERQRLVELINKHGTVEFLQDQFVDDVERKTDVEVALIYLDKVPGKYLDMEALMGDLKRGDNGMSELDPEDFSALALPSNFIADTCFRFEQAVAAARKASEAMAVSDHLSAALGLTLDEMQAKGVGNNFREASGSIREAANSDFKQRYDDLKKRAWAQILRSSLLTDKLSNQARRKIEASAANIYELEFSAANVHGFLLGVIESLGQIFEDMVVGLFDSIIERSSDNAVFYKSWASNRKHRIGMRIRKTRFILPRFRMSYGGNLDYEDERFLSDIDKVFSYLFGCSGAYDGLVQGFRNNRPESGDRISTRFFDFRFYRGVGTMHFYPKSEAVVEKLNLFVGKRRNWIPGDMEQANADFEKQYDKGEALTAEYLKHYKTQSRSSYGMDRPAISLLREINGTNRDGSTLELDRLEKAIETVHEIQGLHCGPRLTASAPLKAIPSNAASASVNEDSLHGQQLLLTV